MDTEGEAPVETIVHVTAQVYVKVVDPTTVRTIEGITISIVIIDLMIIWIEHQHVRIQVVGLCESLRTIVARLTLIADEVIVGIEVEIVTSLMHITDLVLMVGQRIL